VVQFAGAVALSVGLLTGPSAFAHRLDEYLEATTISVERDRVHAQIRLTPGVAVFPAALRSIDTDADRVISQPERRAYAAEVLRDLSFTIDGSPLRPRLISMTFPKVEEMKEGRGEIQLEFYADLPRGGPNRRLVYENRHQSRISAYLVNCLVPRDPGLRIIAQNRNYSQSFYQLDYVQTGGGSDSRFPTGSSAGAWLGAAAIVLFARVALLRRHRDSPAPLRRDEGA